jgi:hypothetical protein
MNESKHNEVTAVTCACGRTFNNHQGLTIHIGRSKQGPMTVRKAPAPAAAAAEPTAADGQPLDPHQLRILYMRDVLETATEEANLAFRAYRQADLASTAAYQEYQRRVGAVADAFDALEAAKQAKS